MLPPLSELRRRLDRFEINSRDLVEGCLAAIDDADGEGSKAFTRVYADSARKDADAIDARLRRGEQMGPLAGIPVSIKDLFDVAGETTTAGSAVLAGTPPARANAVIVERLRSAGAVFVGRTNMTELAYSGLGLNPHYGTPRNPYDRQTGRIPGGSSSGAAVSVSDGMASVGIGSDTGGSVRIPAALCGLTGYKPTARRVATNGMLPLVPSLDSIGPIAPTVACCALVDAVLAGEAVQPLEIPGFSSLRLGVLQGYVLDGLDSSVGTAFERALARLRAAGANVTDISFAALDRIPVSNRIGPVEAFAWHRVLLEEHRQRIDPRVLARMSPGELMPAWEYLDLLRIRREILVEAASAFAGYDALLMPTTAWTAPSIAALEASDTAYFEANGAMLRNPSVFNYLDGCALSVPCHLDGEAPVGLMVAGLGGCDAMVLRAGVAIELALRSREGSILQG